MAKKSIILRQQKREKLVKQYAEKRRALKAIIVDPNSSFEQQQEASHALAKMPRDSSASRLKNRCNVTGRPKAYYRRFGISRLVFRRLAHRGELPGVRKASW